jgi:hypothetical protein
MIFQPIRSSHLLAIGYDADDQTLAVQFEGGAVYQYYGVPQSLYQRMLDSQPHPWSAVCRSLRRYVYQEVA